MRVLLLPGLRVPVALHAVPLVAVVMRWRERSEQLGRR